MITFKLNNITIKNSKFLGNLIETDSKFLSWLYGYPVIYNFQHFYGLKIHITFLLKILPFQIIRFLKVLFLFLKLQKLNRKDSLLITLKFNNMTIKNSLFLSNLIEINSNLYLTYKQFLYNFQHFYGFKIQITSLLKILHFQIILFLNVIIFYQILKIKIIRFTFPYIEFE